MTQRLHPRSFRLLKLSAPHDEFIAFGLAAAVWRGLCFALASLLVLWREAPSLPAAAAAFHALGVRSTLGGTLLLAGSGLAFPVAVALTTATNVLVILAMTPFACALMSRATGVRLPLHAWIAAVCGVASVGLVFATGVSAGTSQARGCMLALTSMVCFSAFVTLGSYKGAVSCVPAMPLAGALIALLALGALGPKWRYATPAGAADTVLLLLNGCINGCANVLMIIGTQSCPASEVSLISLLETALSPVLVFLVTLAIGSPEVPDRRSVVAGGLIVLTLVGHTAFDMHLERRRRRREAEAMLLEMAPPSPSTEAAPAPATAWAEAA